MGCATLNRIISKTDTTIYTGQIKNGMTTEDVLEIMGEPILSELYNNVDEWHYCRTGDFKDAYAVLFFIDNKLISKQQYNRLLWLRTGNCENFLKKDDYKISSEVQAIRDKNN